MTYSKFNSFQQTKTTRDTAARTVAGWLKGDGDTDPATPTIIDLLGQLGVTGNDASLAVPLVRALLVPDPLERAGTVPMTVADVIAALSHWPQHAVVEVNTGAGPQALTDLDVSTSHAAFTTPVVVLTPAMRAETLG